MVKINPGSNRNEDNDLKTATPGMLNVNIPEPKMLEKGRFQCTVCNATFNSREDYISHAMARHQTEPEAEISMRNLKRQGKLQGQKLQRKPVALRPAEPQVKKLLTQGSPTSKP